MPIDFSYIREQEDESTVTQVDADRQARINVGQKDENQVKRVAQQASAMGLYQDDREKIYDLVSANARNDLTAGMNLDSAANYFSRAQAEKEKIEEAGGLEGTAFDYFGTSGLGVVRSVYDAGEFISNTISNVGQTVGITGRTLFGQEAKPHFGGAKPGETVLGGGIFPEKEYERVKKISSIKYLNILEEGNILDVIQEAWKDIPVKEDSANWMSRVLNAASDNPTVIGSGTIEQATKFFRPEASIIEQMIRIAPEAYGGLKLGMALARGSFTKRARQIAEEHNKLVDQGVNKGEKINIVEGAATGFWSRGKEKTLLKTAGVTGKRKGLIAPGGVSILAKLSDDDLSNAIEMAASNNLRFSSKFFGKTEAARARSLSNKYIRTAQYDRMNSTILDINKQIQRTSNRLDIAELKRAKKSAIPFDYKSVAATEVFMQGSFIATGNIYGEEYAWIGALGGGVGSGLLAGLIHGASKKTTKAVTAFGVEMLDRMGLMKQDDIEFMVRTGKVSMRLSKELKGDTAALEGMNDLANLIKSLPENMREDFVKQARAFKEKVAKVVAEEGIDENLLMATVGQAMALGPLMALRNALKEEVMDPSKALAGSKFNQETLTKNAQAFVNMVSTEKTFSEGVEQFGRAIRNLKSGTEDVSGDALKGVIDDLDNAYRSSLEEMMKGNDAISRQLDDVFSFLLEPSTSHSIKNKAAFEETIETIMMHFSNQAKMFPKAQEQLSEKARQLRDIIEQFRTGDGDPQTVTILFDELTKYKGTVNKLLHNLHGTETIAKVDDIGERLTSRLKVLYEVQTEAANRNFDDITDKFGDVPINVTSWFKSFYGESDTSIYTHTLPSDTLSLVSQRTADTMIPKGGTLKQLLDKKSDEALEDWWGSLSTIEKQNIAEEINKLELNGFQRSVDQGLERGVRQDVVEPADVVAYLTDKMSAYRLRDAFSKGDNTIGSFDAFEIAEEVSRVVSDSPIQINISIEDAIKWTNSFNKSARKNFQAGNMDVGEKYSTLSKNLIDSLDSTDPNISPALQDAKSFWNREVYQRYFNNGLPSLGNTWIRSKTSLEGQYREPSTMSWIQKLIGNNISKGKATDAQKVVQILTRTFGKAVTNEDGTVSYKLTTEPRKVMIADKVDPNLVGPVRQTEHTIPSGLEQVRDILESMVTLHVDELTGVLRERSGSFLKLSEVTGKNLPSGSILKGDDKLKEIEDFKSVSDELHKLINKPLTSQFLRGLMEVDASRYVIGDYSSPSTVSFFNPETIADRWNKELLNTRKYSEQMNRAKIENDRLINKGKKEAESTLKIHTTLIGDLLNKSGIKEVSKIKNYDDFKTMFIDNIDGPIKLEDSIVKAAAGKAKKEKQIRAHVKDITIEAIDRAFRKDDVVSTGLGYERIFDHKGLTEYLQDKRNIDTLKKIIGKDTHKRLLRLSEVLNVLNANADEFLKRSNMTVKVPTGLGLNSWISRVYSVSRGVVSPKYVATEALLLAMKIKNINSVAALLDDPKTLDALLDILENPYATSKEYMQYVREYNRNLRLAFIDSYAKKEVGESKRKRQRQMDELRSR